MKILLDENLPPGLRRELAGHEVFSVRYMGWDGIKNGSLIAKAAEAQFDVMLTMDGSIPHQHNVQELPISIVVIVAALNDMTQLRPIVPQIENTLRSLAPRSVAYVG